ncbi:hypothetical protein R6Q59_016717 [Mikania micrantha]
MEMVLYREVLTGPFEFGSYSSGTTPDRIPYHLYMLVKEAVDIMKRHNNTSDVIDLITVEKKITFFCTYFYSHLPTGWNYNRDIASSLIASYDTTVNPRYLMAGYTPIEGPLNTLNYDEETKLSLVEMVEKLTLKKPALLTIIVVIHFVSGLRSGGQLVMNDTTAIELD